MMEDLITDLRNKTAMCRFTRGEVAVILEYLAEGGYLTDPKPMPDLSQVDVFLPSDFNDAARELMATYDPAPDMRNLSALTLPETELIHTDV